MFRLRFPEVSYRLDFGDDLTWPQARGVNVRDGFLGNSLLLVI